jgi:hypothetical protein
MLERLDKGNSRILTTAAAVRPPLIIRLRFECDAESFDSAWIAGFVEFYAGDADA